MYFSAKLTNRGISLSLSDEPPKRLAPVEGTPQEKPRGSYVYAHLTADGKYFYIGKGTGDRAWSAGRDSLWYRYVNNHLNGEFRVLILQDNLTPEEALELESEWMAQESETLVNLMNFGRKSDYSKLATYHKLRNANRELIANAHGLEKTDLAAAAVMYIRAIAASDQYVEIDGELGLVGQLLREERAENGKSGEFEAIDRLSLCLVKLGRADEAASHVERYFKRFVFDARSKRSERIRKRIQKALLRNPM